MQNYTFVPSILETKTMASLDLEVEKDLNTPESSRTIAQLLKSQHNEEKTSSDQEDKGQIQ